MLTRPIPKTAKVGVLGTIAIIIIAAVLLPMARAEKSNKEASATPPGVSEGAAENAPQGAWYYHVKTGGTGGRPVQSEADPGLSSCWNSIIAAFAAVKSRATPGPWVIQVDDEATYDEAVALTDLQTSPTETLTLTKAPWLTGRPTIYPSQPGKRALAINGLWRGVATSEPLPDQPGQPANRVTYVTVRGFTLRNNAQGTDRATEQPLFTDKQDYLTEGLHIIEDCCFDGQNQVYDSILPMFVGGTCINTVFRRNVFQDLRRNEDSMKEGKERDLFAMTPPASTVMGQPQITMADNTFRGNRGTVFVGVGDAANQRYYRVVFERNRISGNYNPSILVTIWRNPLSTIVRNNIFSDNSGGSMTRGTYESRDASNTKIYHNTFFNNHAPREIAVHAGSTEGVEIKNNIFWPTPGSYCIEVEPGCTENLVCANNAFFTDFKKDGYPPGFGFTTTENTETIGSWNGKPMTTDAWKKASKNNMGNGYTFGGPGMDKNMHLVAGSLCIDRGVPGLARDDVDGMQRPVGTACDIGADEYGTTGRGRSPAGGQEPPLEGQQLVLDTPICLAAHTGDVAKIEQCIQEGVDVNKLDGCGYAPLHYAAQNNQKQAMGLLIAKGGDINVKDSRGQTPLYRASTAGNRDVAELLISKGAEVNAKGKDGETALHGAVANQQKDVAELLISKGAEVNAKGKDGQTALHGAVDNQQKDMVELLLSRGAGLNAKDGKGYTPLYYAIWNEDQDIVRLLVANAADVSYTPKDDYPPLHYAVWNQDVNTVRLLVDHGAKFDVKDQDGWSALRYAAWQGSQDILNFFVSKEIDISTLPLAACVGTLARVKSLVEQGAEINAKDELGWTPLYWAASAGRTQIAEFLIAKGADVKASNEAGHTPLHLAARNGRKDVAELLIAGGADLNARANSGVMPVHDAARNGHKPVVELLLAKGPDVNAKTPDDLTALHWAVLRGHNDVVEFLIAKGADVNAKNKSGQTPLKWAVQTGRTETVELLRKHGAKE